MSTVSRELYFSVDVETDGPIPGPYSMVSIGAACVGYLTSDGEVVTLDADDRANQFYAEIKPISEQWDPEALAVSGLDRDYLITHGQIPQAAMTAFAAWVTERVAFHEAKGGIFAAYPLGFDWLFTYWYLVNFAEQGSPFGHSKHIDMKTLYAARAGEQISRSVKGRMPRSLLSKRQHTHNALDDAIEQGELLLNLLRWNGSR